MSEVISKKLKFKGDKPKKKKRSHKEEGSGSGGGGGGLDDLAVLAAADPRGMSSL
jgi:protein FRG1